ncbi:MAG: non-heme iron oxygenase ferredoxin subunit [Acidimicrobiales bacterium]
MAEQRTRLCAVVDIDVNGSRRFEIGPHKICLVRLGDDFYAIGDTCSHADYSLAEGEIDPDTLQVECWKHGSCFSLKTGEPDTLPATKPVPTYDVDVEGDDVYVTVSD